MTQIYTKTQADAAFATPATVATTVVTGVNDPASAIGAVVPLKGGATKTDGQNIARLRRPTLAVEKMFPNARTDHQIVWVDETLKVAYSIGQDNRLRKAVWTFAPNEALTWGTFVSAAPSGTWWCQKGVFLRIPSTGELLLDQVNNDGTGTVLRRSTDDGATWTTVWTASGGKKFLGPQSVARDANTGYLYLVEYTVTVGDTTADIYRSTDAGATWTLWKSYPRADATPGTPGTIRHWHSARYDSVSQRMYFMAGDTNDDGGIWRVNAAGTDIEPVILNRQIAAQFPDTPTCARAVDVMFFPNYIAWATDGGGGQPHVNRIARTQIGQPTPVAERIAAIDNTGWFSVKASANGTTWVCSTSTEDGVVGWTPDAGLVHLYAVTNDGAQVDEVASVAMDGNKAGFGSLSGLSGPSGEGDAFWMRAHTYQAFPFQTYSAFQFRARLSNGVTQIQKPIETRRRAGYLRQGRASGPIVVAAGTTVAFGHTRCPRSTLELFFFDYGVKSLIGTANVGQLEVWNVTTSTLIKNCGVGQSARYDATADVDEWLSHLTLAAGDQIEFRINNTGGSSITASGFVEFGFGYT